MKHINIDNATKSDDWKIVNGANCGDDSYRVYQSEKVQEEVMENGKNYNNSDTDFLKGKTDFHY